MARDEYRYTRKRSGTDKIPFIMLLIFLAAIILMDQFFHLGFNWVDYTIIGIVFFCAFVGYAKGLISAIFSLAGYVAAIVCAVLFSERAALWIMENTKIDESISEALQKVYSGIGIPAFNQTTDFAGIENNYQFLEQYPELQTFFQENLTFSQLFESVKPFESGTQAIQNTLTSVTDVLIFSILKVIAIIAVFLIVKIVISIIGQLINSLISQSSFLNTTNKTIGLLLGTIIGCIIIFVMVSFVIPFVGSMSYVQIPEEYEQSQVLSWIYAAPAAP